MKEEEPDSLEQLKRAFEAGLIDEETYNAATGRVTARLEGGGAIAQGSGSTALGAQSASVGQDNYGIVNTGQIIQTGTKPGASKQDLRRAYLARILNQANHLPLFSGDGNSAQVRLSSVYTALLTNRSEGELRVGHLLFEPERSSEHDKKLSALDVLNREKTLVLLGGPGSGKSTFVNFVALCMAGELLGADAINLESLCAPIPSESNEEPEAQHWNHGALLPVPVILRDFASELPAPGKSVNAQTVWRHIEGRLKIASLGDFAPYLQEELLTRGGLILLDGLDEVADPSVRREQIKEALRGFSNTFHNCRYLVTSRTYAYTRQDWKLGGFAEVALLPFSPLQVRQFVDVWYAHMVELDRLSKFDADGRADLLKQTIDRNPRLAELAEHPLLLTLIARLHTEKGGALPEKREELYAQAVEHLLTEWERLKPYQKPDGSRGVAPSLAEFLNTGRDNIRCELDKLAFEAHRDQADLLGTADIRQERLIQALLDAAPDKSDIKPRLLEEYLCDRAGILAAHGEGLLQFPHRTFQEYLAACHLTTEKFPDEISRLLREDPDRWREAVLLAAAKVARGTPESV